MPRLKQEIEVAQRQKGSWIGILKTFWNQADPHALEDITGYTIQLVVKPALDDTITFFTLSASLTDPTVGEYTFTFTMEHTFLPAGTWPGEIRFWSGGTSVAPDRVIPIDYVVHQKT